MTPCDRCTEPSIRNLSRLVGNDSHSARIVRLPAGTLQGLLKGPADPLYAGAIDFFFLTVKSGTSAKLFAVGSRNGPLKGHKEESLLAFLNRRCESS